MGNFARGLFVVRVSETNYKTDSSMGKVRRLFSVRARFAPVRYKFKSETNYDLHPYRDLCENSSKLSFLFRNFHDFHKNNKQTYTQIATIQKKHPNWTQQRYLSQIHNKSILYSNDYKILCSVFYILLHISNELKIFV